MEDKNATRSVLVCRLDKTMTTLQSQTMAPFQSKPQFHKDVFFSVGLLPFALKCGHCLALPIRRIVFYTERPWRSGVFIFHRGLANL